MQGTKIRPLVWEDSTCHGAAKPVHHSYWAHTLLPVSRTYWTLHTLEALQQEKPLQWEAYTQQLGSRPCLLQLAEKAMAPHSSTLAWKIPWMEEPGRLQSMGSLRVGHDWVTSLSLFIFMHWRRKWQPTPVFLPGESQGQGNLVGCRLWGHTESDTTEVT